MMEGGAEVRRLERALLVDADDTLWENNIFYLRCATRFVERMACLGIAPEAAQAALEACERETIPRFGYGPQGYIEALAMACERLLRHNGDVVDAELLAEVRDIGGLVLAPPMILLSGVEATLPALRPSSRLVLVTKGDHDTQLGKLARSGLAPHFDATYVVAEKDSAVYRDIAADLGLVPGHTWMIGNSPRSDINPAIDAGLGAIYIPHSQTWTAEIEELTRPERVVTLQRFADLLPFFGIEPLPGA